MTQTNDSGAVEEGVLLWEPSAGLINGARLAQYERWLASHRGLTFETYDDLWRWSVTELEDFWKSVWDFSDVHSYSPYNSVLMPSPTGNRVEGARWFEGATLNYAEHCLRRDDDYAAVIATHESGPTTTTTFAELRRLVAEFAAGLRELGVGPGDAVVAYLPNVTEAVVASLASASIGAAWSSCPPEFGTPSVIDRFQQVVGFFFFDGEVTVAADAKRRPTLHDHAHEELVEFGADDFLGRHEAAGRTFDQAREHVGNLEASKASIAGLRIGNVDGKRQRQV